jgi:hypothetical protein
MVFWIKVRRWMTSRNIIFVIKEKNVEEGEEKADEKRKLWEK